MKNFVIFADSFVSGAAKSRADRSVDSPHSAKGFARVVSGCAASTAKISENSPEKGFVRFANSHANNPARFASHLRSQSSAPFARFLRQTSRQILGKILGWILSQTQRQILRPTQAQISHQIQSKIQHKISSLIQAQILRTKPTYLRFDPRRFLRVLFIWLHLSRRILGQILGKIQSQTQNQISSQRQISLQILRQILGKIQSQTPRKISRRAQRTQNTTAWQFVLPCAIGLRVSFCTGAKPATARHQKTPKRLTA
ncbi:MAG: hypothetical protein ACTTIC_07785 [Helicobacteraceae bacterium]